jgi:histidine triad (HIT) family protein
MSECIFCKIAAGEIPSHKIAQSVNFIAMLDIAPSAEGHVLVIPKKHSTNLLDLPEYMGNEWLEFTQKVAAAVVAELGADGFNLVLNNGAPAGQVVFHTHFHILPRKANDGLKVSMGQKKDYGDIAALRDRLRARF